MGSSRLAMCVCFSFMACSKGGVAPSDAGGGDLASVPSFTLRIEPPMISGTVNIGVVPAGVALHAIKTESGVDSDVTSQVAWTVDTNGLATVDASGSLRAGPHGGAGRIHAVLAAQTATVTLTVLLKGDVFGTGTDATTKQKIDTATPDATAANAPSLEYPLDGTVLPANLPPVELQWSAAADNDTYRAHFTAPNVLDVYVYGSARELAVPAATWALIVGSAPDVAISWNVEATGASLLRRATAMRTFTASSDTIDQSAIYVWQPSTGTFHVIDIAKATDTPLPTTAPKLQPGAATCSGCHRISRDGKRFSYVYSGQLFLGTLKFDAATNTFASAIDPQLTTEGLGSYATFNPSEGTQMPAMLAAIPDSVTMNTPGTVRLALRNPDTNVTVPSNIATMIGQLPATSGRATSMPDWAPDGTFVVFSAYDSDTNYVRLLGDDMVLSSIFEAPVSFDGATFTFGTPKPLVVSTDSNPDTGENNILPSIAPDGAAVAFTRTQGWWSVATQSSNLNMSGQIMVARRSDGHVFTLAKGSTGSADGMNSTWPQWAPTMGARYAWIAYGSERDYGHELTSANVSCGDNRVTGQRSCKQLWVMALDRAKLAAGTDDPSLPPFWIPGQSVHEQYVSPQWTQAVVVQ